MTALDSQILANGKQRVDWADESSETKPIENMASGSTFWEVDTSKVFAFGDISQQWFPQGQQGGGT